MQPTPGSSVYEPAQCVLKSVGAVLTTNLQFINTTDIHMCITIADPTGCITGYTAQNMPEYYEECHIAHTYVCPWDSTPSHPSPLTRFLRFSSLYREWDVAGRIIDKAGLTNRWQLIISLSHSATCH